MPEPTSQEVFGSGFSQDANSFTISKANLAQFGLVADVNNKPEALFAAMVALAAIALNETNRANDRVNRQVTVTPSSFDVVEDPVGSNVYYRRDIFTVIGYSSQPNTPFTVASY